MHQGSASIGGGAPAALPTLRGYIRNPIFWSLWFLFIGATFFTGHGNRILGQDLPNNVSTYFVYIAFFLQATFFRIRLPRILLWFFGFIVFQTFILNPSQASAIASLIHFAGVVLFAVTAFCFVSFYRRRSVQLVRMYYGFSFLAACLAVAQTASFVFLDQALYVQDMLGGPKITSTALRPEVFDLLPRVLSIASEPAHFATFLLPGAYLALLVLHGRANALRLKSRLIALVVITALFLTFSVVGYIGFALALLFAQRAATRKWWQGGMVVAMGILVLAGWLLSTTLPIYTGKLVTFWEAGSSPGSYEFTTSDLSGFALISNALVAKSALIDSYGLGTGLNTHERNYDRYLSSYFSTSDVLLELNKDDAASLYVRIASELGLPGLVVLVWFLAKYRLRASAVESPYSIINTMSLIFLFVYMARTGSYLNISLWFFAALYYYSFLIEQPRSFKLPTETLSALDSRRAAKS
jgi:hypothetical protein